jgi:ubiquinone/menaquinone biosynthesis C-methylase UbiE
MKEHLESKLFHPSSRPAGQGITIGTPRLYDLSAALLPGGRRRSYRRLLAAAGVCLGDRVLDVGCGPGYFARLLAEAVGPGGSVVGIDAAPEMTEYASRRARRFPNCRFQPGTAESLAFPDASFDVLVSSLVMHHLADDGRLRAVRGMRRVLRPGGTLLLADFAIPERGFWRIVASLTGHARGMQREVPQLEPLVSEAGFTELRSGEAPPWLHYVRATNPPLPGNEGDAGSDAMLTLEATIETERPDRYLVRFCKHAASMGRSHSHGPRVHLGAMLARGEVQVRAEYSETHGTVTFSPWGRCMITAGAGALTLRIEATDEENLRQIQDIVTRDLDRFSGQDHLVVVWRRPEAPGASSGGGPAV